MSKERSDWKIEERKVNDPVNCLEPDLLHHEARRAPFCAIRVVKIRRRNQMRKLCSAVSKSAALWALVVLFSFSGVALSQTKPTRGSLDGDSPQAVLWVGNSFFYYNNSMHGHVGNLVKAADPKSRARGVSLTISGSGIDWHDLDSYLRPDGIGKYSFVGDNEIVFNKPGRQFDAVIMMDCSQCPIHPQLKPVFHDYMKKDSEIVRRYGAQPILFMSWAYKDKPEMTALLAEQYTRAGNQNDALVIPAGLAFAKATSKRPDLELYQRDKRHPTLMGTYLAACTTLATVYRKSPVGNSYDAGLDPEAARFLQGVAWDTVQEYLSK